MKKATGKIKKLLIEIGEIQTLNGKAKSAYFDDRSSCRASKLKPLFEEIHEICVRVRSEYFPIDDK